MNDDLENKLIATCICTAILAIACVIVVCVLTCARLDSQAIAAGYTQVQDIGGTGKHWVAPDVKAAP